ncbi:bacterial Ig-like domain-containing protein, partial [Lactococcus garvieae]|uniref:bacterial Ig-like domain-containing protein n=1 Tax=Lactococcus garvieae TaxID=1363 RepID=UPI00254EF168
MEYKKLTRSGAAIAVAILLTPTVNSLAESSINTNELSPSEVVGNNTPETVESTLNTQNQNSQTVLNSDETTETTITDSDIVANNALGPQVEFSNDVPTSYISSSSGVSFTWNMKTIKGENEIKVGDKIVLSISGVGLDYSTIKFSSGGTSDPYFDLVLDEENGQIILVAKQNVQFDGNISTTLTARPTSIEGPEDFPFTSSYIPVEGDPISLTAGNMTLHVKNSNGGSWAVVGTPTSPGHHWGAIEANGHGVYNPNNNGTDLPGKFYYTHNAQNWFSGLFNGNYTPVSGKGPYTFIINSNYPIDTESFILSAGKIGAMSDGMSSYNIQWENDNKTVKITFDDLKATGQMGSALAATYYGLTNTINDEVSIESYAVDNSGSLIGTKSTATGTYYPTSSGSFLPSITAVDKTVYTSDAALDLKSLASAHDQIDGDISQNIKVIDSGGFDQSKPGIYTIKYQVSNSFGEIAETTATVTVIEDKTTISAYDSTIYVGDAWKPEDNFDNAVDKEGNPVDFSQVKVSGTVDNTKPGKYDITYTFDGVSKTITVTVLDIKTSIFAHDSTIYVGDAWKPEDNFDNAVDKEGNPVDFSQVKVSGTVDNT